MGEGRRTESGVNPPPPLPGGEYEGKSGGMGNLEEGVGKNIP